MGFSLLSKSLDIQAHVAGDGDPSNDSSHLMEDIDMPGIGLDGEAPPPYSPLRSSNMGDQYTNKIEQSIEWSSKRIFWIRVIAFVLNILSVTGALFKDQKGNISWFIFNDFLGICLVLSPMQILMALVLRFQWWNKDELKYAFTRCPSSRESRSESLSRGSQKAIWLCTIPFDLFVIIGLSLNVAFVGHSFAGPNSYSRMNWTGFYIRIVVIMLIAFAMLEGYRGVALTDSADEQDDDEDFGLDTSESRENVPFLDSIVVTRGLTLLLNSISWISDSTVGGWGSYLTLNAGIPIVLVSYFIWIFLFQLVWRWFGRNRTNYCQAIVLGNHIGYITPNKEVTKLHFKWLFLLWDLAMAPLMLYCLLGMRPFAFIFGMLSVVSHILASVEQFIKQDATFPISWYTPLELES